MLIDRQKDHGHAIGAGLGQLDPQFPALARKKDMRNLDQDACAVARFRIATRSATMCELEQDLKALTNNLVAFFSANAGNKGPFRTRRARHVDGKALVAAHFQDDDPVYSIDAWQPFGEPSSKIKAFLRRVIAQKTQPHADFRTEIAPF